MVVVAAEGKSKQRVLTLLKVYLDERKVARLNNFLWRI